MIPMPVRESQHRRRVIWLSSMAFLAQNIQSANLRLSMYAEDIREELKSSEDNLDLCSQLGALMGMWGLMMNSFHTGFSLVLIIGLCFFFHRRLGDAPSMITYYEESAEFRLKLPTKDLEFRLIKLETFATMMETSNLREVVMPYIRRWPLRIFYGKLTSGRLIDHCPHLLVYYLEMLCSHGICRVPGKTCLRVTSLNQCGTSHGGTSLRVKF